MAETRTTWPVAADHGISGSRLGELLQSLADTLENVSQVGVSHNTWRQRQARAALMELTDWLEANAPENERIISILRDAAGRTFSGSRALDAGRVPAGKPRGT